MAVSSSTRNSRLFSFGLIADVQYANIDNRLNFSQTKWRYYRNSVNLLREAVDHWIRESQTLTFIAQLGDIIDGFNNRSGKKESEKSLKLVLSELQRTNVPLHHTWGNHEFYNFTRQELVHFGLFSGRDLPKSQNLLMEQSVNVSQFLTNGQNKSPPKDAIQYKKKSPNEFPAYYSFTPYTGFRFINLDTYDMSVLGYDEDCETYKTACKLLRSKNKNPVWNSPVGLPIDDTHFLGFNGGLGQEQLRWLDEVLAEADQVKEKVVILAHVPLFPKVDRLCLLWNYQEVLGTIHKHRSVVAIFNGHTHEYGYHIDSQGIHHVILPGVIEVPPDHNAFCSVDVFDDRLVVRGWV